MSITIDQLRLLIKIDYFKLCSHVKLESIDLDVHLYDSNSDTKSDYGLDVNVPWPAYSPEVIALPVAAGDIEVYANQGPPFPPGEWNKLNSQNWPVWRIELWHEVVHQIEDQVLGIWKPGSDNDKTWRKAASKLAETFNVSANEIEKLLAR